MASKKKRTADPATVQAQLFAAAMVADRATDATSRALAEILHSLADAYVNEPGEIEATKGGPRAWARRRMRERPQLAIGVERAETTRALVSIARRSSRKDLPRIAALYLRERLALFGVVGVPTESAIDAALSKLERSARYEATRSDDTRAEERAKAILRAAGVPTKTAQNAVDVAMSSDR